ncbi:MAG: LptF/LptG family permease [bacterium]
MRILWRHILRSHVAPLLFSTFILMGVFLLQFIIQKMDQLAGKGLSAGIIAELFIMNLAWMVVLAVPMAVLVATLMAFGGLSSNNEITAMRATGISLYRMMLPTFLASIVLYYALVYFNNTILPDANHRAKILLTDIYRKKPTLSFVPGLFSQGVQGYSILVRKTFENSNDLEGMTIIDYTIPNLTTTVTARRGVVSFSADYQKIIMDLFDGEIHEVNNSKMERYRIIKFQKHRIAMNAEGFDFQRSQESAFSRGDRELSASAMQAIVDSVRLLQQEAQNRIRTAVKNDLDQLFFPSPTPSTSSRSIQDPMVSASVRVATLRNSIEGDIAQINHYSRRIHEYSVEIQKKYSIPFACIVFVLVGAPLGIMVRRGTFGIAASFSLGFFVLYWSCLIGGERLADRGFIQPWFGMWIANILIGILGFYLTVKTARENLVIDWSQFRRFIPKQFRWDETSS